MVSTKRVVSTALMGLPEMPTCSSIADDFGAAVALDGKLINCKEHGAHNRLVRHVIDPAQLKEV